jgi:hypothetical protein
MNLRHAAALALVGWYLMLPPASSETHYPIGNAPMWQWEVIGSFDSAAECTRAKSAREASNRAKWERISPEPHNPFRPYSGVQELAREIYLKEIATACIATDDPRLKGK